MSLWDCHLHQGLCPESSCTQVVCISWGALSLSVWACHCVYALGARFRGNVCELSTWSVHGSERAHQCGCLCNRVCPCHCVSVRVPVTLSESSLYTCVWVCVCVCPGQRCVHAPVQGVRLCSCGRVSVSRLVLVALAARDFVYPRAPVGQSVYTPLGVCVCLWAPVSVSVCQCAFGCPGCSAARLGPPGPGEAPPRPRLQGKPRAEVGGAARACKSRLVRGGRAAGGALASRGGGAWDPLGGGGGGAAAERAGDPPGGLRRAARATCERAPVGGGGSEISSGGHDADVPASRAAAAATATAAATAVRAATAAAATAAVSASGARRARPPQGSRPPPIIAPSGVFMPPG